MSQLITRTACQNLLQKCTVKIFEKNGKFIGTGFFILPNMIASCLHVFNNHQVTHFKISGHNQIFSTKDKRPNEKLDLICIPLENIVNEYCIPLQTINQIREMNYGGVHSILKTAKLRGI